MLFVSGSLYAQTGKCSLTLANIPQASELVGFQLGMTKAQVKTRVPQVVFGPMNELGVSKTTINPHFDPRIDQSGFAGVRTVSLVFLDDRLTSLWIGYDSSLNVNSVQEFVKKISQSLRLTDAWKTRRSRGKQLNSADFQLSVTMVADGPSFRILDLTAEDSVAARRETKAEQDVTAAESTEETAEVVADKRNKIYYPAGCQPAPTIAYSDRVIFKTAEEADKAGFKAAKTCP
jgi:hypothetical protein